ncbi:DUF2332 domain-containing protein [Amycolatopsis pigmentata]|uniref:DUF2332 domain-containing protein n=1 Tax=Amycolatopsis pigmentata TaxID=450801 RepID=A0ABW5G5Y7_9PSEU
MVEDDIARDYRVFGREARGRSQVYEEISAHVPGDPGLREFLTALPRPKQQPNLLYGAVQYLYGPIRDWPSFRETVLGHEDEVRAVMMRRRTQTNEAARCALLLPALAALPEPLALIEVGASAGLCLLPDRYGYDYPGGRIAGSPMLSCRANAATPVPDRVPEIIWRAGLDLNPLDITDESDCAWLHALIWPGEEYRHDILRQALDIARQDPPRVVRGDLRTDLATLAAEAPSDATLVVFHTAVLAYLHDDEPGREAFAEAVASTGAVWLANESPRVIPGVEAPGPRPEMAPLLVQDGRPLAWTDGHGTWIEWL